MFRFFSIALLVAPLLGCSQPDASDRVALVAPTPDGAREARRCDDGGEGGVLIDGICL